MTLINTQTHRQFIKWITVAAALCLSLEAGLAQESSKSCGEFKLFPEYIEVDSIDHPPAGHSSGDTRFVQISLVDEDGTQVAEITHTAVIIPGGTADLPRLLVDGFIEFPSGILRVGGLYTRPNLTEAAPGAPDEFEAMIQGGTGSFVGYSGVIKFSRDEQNRRIYQFEIPC